jgi:hypothetical protein
MPLPGDGSFTKLSLSDDTRLVSHSRAGIVRVLEVAERACHAASASVNPGNLKAYHTGRLVSSHVGCLYDADLVSSMGPLPLTRGSVLFAGLPMLMGDCPTGPRTGP